MSPMSCQLLISYSILCLICPTAQSLFRPCGFNARDVSFDAAGSFTGTSSQAGAVTVYAATVVFLHRRVQFQRPTMLDEH